MPLIIVCGLPCSGKTKRTEEICEILAPELEKRGWSAINVVNDDLAGVKYSDYGDFAAEKEARGRIRNQVEKYISKSSITIVDSPNYIKGFRYELWCIARAASTTCCTLVPVGNHQLCRERNIQREEDNTVSYTKVQLDELIMRWEEPDKNRRWESPLIPVLDEDEIENEVLLAAISGKGLKSNRATTNPPLKSTDFLQETDKKVKEIIKQILIAQKEAGDCGVSIKVTLLVKI
ncbi:unnamed protein product [Oikopleura dioica]|uniref:Protein KTI12 homolog n=1 Tax=Oikopleura dioica TaxID=34765 RepID=E4XRU8_OIKDI|nr:unnamed protein product [Oikopleura dioica]